MAKKTPLTFQQRVGPEPKPKKQSNRSVTAEAAWERAKPAADKAVKERANDMIRKNKSSVDHALAMAESLERALKKVERKKK